MVEVGWCLTSRLNENDGIGRGTGPEGVFVGKQRGKY